MSLHSRTNVDDNRVEFSASRKCTTVEDITQHEAFDAYGENMPPRYVGTGDKGDIMSCCIILLFI